MPRAAFYVDGFNLYHSLKGTPKTAKTLWLDLWSLCNAIKHPTESLEKVVYFTALTPWNPSKQKRHQTFLSALRFRGVEVVLGRFAAVMKECGSCGQTYSTHEEKETDVNISSRIIRDALAGSCETLYLLTGDSDQVATIRTVRELAPTCQVVSVFSVNRHSAELKSVSHRSVQLSWKHFKRNQLPNPLEVGPGHILECPPTWMP